jgi:hypothetical protein
MKVVGQQAIRKGIGHRGNVFGVELQEVREVAFFDEEIAAFTPRL